jgi:hypothetical protein
MFRLFKKIIVLSLISCFVFEQTGFAQVAAPMGIPAYLSGFSIPDKFRPVHLRYLSYDPLANNFDLLLDKGDAKDLKQNQIEETTQELLKYFQVGITLPNKSFWVNLRPDGENDVIDPLVEKTDLGKILLEADLQLKKDMAKCTSPDTAEGRQYWDKLYQKAESLFGGMEVSIPTLTRPWIVPGEIIIRETDESAYIYKATLKVMLEQDYLKDSAEYSFDDKRLKILNDYSSDLLRKLIIPKLTKMVNSSKQYAPLRQVYYSLILAQWFKQKFHGREGIYSSRIDTMDLSDLTSKTKWSKSTYFKAYQKSFKNGEYNLSESVYNSYGQTIRSYVSGGMALDVSRYVMEAIRTAGQTSVQLASGIKGYLLRAEATDGNLVIERLAKDTAVSEADQSQKDGGLYDDRLGRESKDDYYSWRESKFERAKMLADEQRTKKQLALDNFKNKDRERMERQLKNAKARGAVVEAKASPIEVEAINTADLPAQERKASILEAENKFTMDLPDLITKPSYIVGVGVNMIQVREKATKAILGFITYSRESSGEAKVLLHYVYKRERNRNVGRRLIQELLLSLAKKIGIKRLTSTELSSDGKDIWTRMFGESLIEHVSIPKIHSGDDWESTDDLRNPNDEYDFIELNPRDYVDIELDPILPRKLLEGFDIPAPGSEKFADLCDKIVMGLTYGYKKEMLSERDYEVIDYFANNILAASGMSLKEIIGKLTTEAMFNNRDIYEHNTQQLQSIFRSIFIDKDKQDGGTQTISQDEAEALKRVLGSNNYSKFISAVMTIVPGAIAYYLWLNNELNLSAIGTIWLQANLVLTAFALGYGLLHMAVSVVTDRSAIKISGGNPLQTDFWPIMILSNALDGVLDMPEVLRNPYSLPKNLGRAMGMPAGLITTAGMLLIDAGIDLLTDIKRKKEKDYDIRTDSDRQGTTKWKRLNADIVMLKTAWENASGKDPRKQLNAVSNRFVYVESLDEGNKKNILRFIIFLEMLRYHLNLERNGLFEDTHESNIHLDPMGLFFILWREKALGAAMNKETLKALLKLDKETLKALLNIELSDEEFNDLLNDPIVKSTPFNDKEELEENMIEEYLERMRAIYLYIFEYKGEKYEDKVRHFIPKHEMPLYNLIYEKYGAKRYVTFELLWLLDQLGKDLEQTFTADSFAISQATIDAMVGAKMIEPAEEDSYRITEEFRNNLEGLVSENYEEVRDEKGVLFFKGKAYRFNSLGAQPSVNKDGGSAQKDGGATTATAEQRDDTLIQNAIEHNKKAITNNIEPMGITIVVQDNTGHVEIIIFPTSRDGEIVKGIDTAGNRVAFITDRRQKSMNELFVPDDCKGIYSGVLEIREHAKGPDDTKKPGLILPAAEAFVVGETVTDIMGRQAQYLSNDIAFTKLVMTAWYTSLSRAEAPLTIDGVRTKLIDAFEKEVTIALSERDEEMFKVEGNEVYVFNIKIGEVQDGMVKLISLSDFEKALNGSLETAISAYFGKEDRLADLAKQRYALAILRIDAMLQSPEELQKLLITLEDAFSNDKPGPFVCLYAILGELGLPTHISFYGAKGINQFWSYYGSKFMELLFGVRVNEIGFVTSIDSSGKEAWQFKNNSLLDAESLRNILFHLRAFLIKKADISEENLKAAIIANGTASAQQKDGGRIGIRIDWGSIVVYEKTSGRDLGSVQRIQLGDWGGKDALFIQTLPGYLKAMDKGVLDVISSASSDIKDKIGLRGSGDLLSTAFVIIDDRMLLKDTKGQLYSRQIDDARLIENIHTLADYQQPFMGRYSRPPASSWKVRESVNAPPAPSSVLNSLNAIEGLRLKSSERVDSSGRTELSEFEKDGGELNSALEFLKTRGVSENDLRIIALLKQPGVLNKIDPLRKLEDLLSRDLALYLSPSVFKLILGYTTHPDHRNQIRNIARGLISQIFSKESVLSREGFLTMEVLDSIVKTLGSTNNDALLFQTMLVGLDRFMDSENSDIKKASESIIRTSLGLTPKMPGDYKVTPSQERYIWEKFKNREFPEDIREAFKKIEESIKEKEKKDEEELIRMINEHSNLDGGNKGGIDFRQLPIVTQPAVNNPQLVVVGPAMQMSESSLNEEWKQIEKAMQNGPMPYQKIKEYVTCCRNQKADKQMDAVFACIANILRLEEEQALPTAPEIKEILSSIG